MNRREFHLVEGTSSKFWAVSVTDCSMTVQYGKIGSSGQTQLKTFASTTEAQQAAEKLITEKSRKGYKEVDSAAPARAPAPEAAPAPKAAPTPTAPLTCERRLNLAPGDWQRARRLERPTSPLPPLSPRPFDLAALKNVWRDACYR